MLQKKCVLIALLLLTPLSYADFTLEDDGGQILVKEDGKPVLVYHYALVQPPEGVPAQYRRAAYIHPLYGLDGEVMTEDFPKDHYHHRGVFWAWPNCKVGERPMDIWIGADVRHYHEKWLEKKADNVCAVLNVQNRWAFDDAPEEAVVREQVSMTVLAADGAGRAIDFIMRFENVSKEKVVFRGATTLKKGYGGLSVRPDSTRKPFTFTTDKETLEKDTTNYKTAWADISYPSKTDGPLSGFAIFQHPDDPGYPHEGWIMRHYGFLGVSWPHNTPHTLAPGESFELRYRLYIHRGGAEAGKVKEAFAEYTEAAK